MSYNIKEIYYTLQGEGQHTGRPAVFCRFSGCNLWSGREKDRENAVCKFCDTDFLGTDGNLGKKYLSSVELVKAIVSAWPRQTKGKRFVVLTGGEPLLQANTDLIQCLQSFKFEVAIETNGTIKCPELIDWICVSPKYGANLIQKSGDELKLIFPQKGIQPEQFIHMNFKYFFLQPMDNKQKQANTLAAIDYCLKHPLWRLSVQTHKLINLP